MTQEEKDLLNIAQFDPNEGVAYEALKELQERFDPTYGYCMECDFLVCKAKDCCMNQ